MTWQVTAWWDGLTHTRVQSWCVVIVIWQCGRISLALCPMSKMYSFPSLDFDRISYALDSDPHIAHYGGDEVVYGCASHWMGHWKGQGTFLWYYSICRSCARGKVYASAWTGSACLLPRGWVVRLHMSWRCNNSPPSPRLTFRCLTDANLLPFLIVSQCGIQPWPFLGFLRAKVISTWMVKASH